MTANTGSSNDSGASAGNADAPAALDSADQKSATPPLRQSWALIRWLLAAFKPHPGLTTVSALLLALVLAIELTLPRILGWTIDLFAVDAAPTITLSTLCWLYIALALIGLCARFTGGIARTVLIQRMATELRLKIHGAIQLLSYRWHGRSSPGEILARATRDVEKIRTFYADVIATGGEILIVILGSVVLIALMNWMLGLIAGVIVAAMLVQVFNYGRRLRQLWRIADDSYDDITLTVQEGVAGARVIRAFGREQDLIERFRRATADFLAKFLVAVRYWAVRMPLSNLLFNLSIPALLLVGGVMISRGTLRLGDLAAAIFYLSAISHKMRVIGRLVESAQDAIASSERIHELLDREHDVSESPASIPMPSVPVAIRFENVEFAGDGSRAIIHDIDLEIPAGTTAALVGPTGSGKSTLAALIPRFFDPQRGRVLLDGRDLRDYRLAELRSRVALVFQDTFLFSATIRENIAFGRPDTTLEQVREAARQAQALEFIESMPDGFETMVGERGVTLSGGQKQRLAIARAYLIDPSILIMDDATASVDSRTEHRLQLAAREVARGRTTILIAHRLSTLQHADQIFVLDHGRIVERGMHDELLARGGLYSRLYKAQQVAGGGAPASAMSAKGATR